MASLIRHLILGLRLALFRPVPADAWHSSVGSLLMLMLASLAMSIGFDWWYLEPKPGLFNPLALRDAFWDLPVLLLLGWLAAGRLARSHNMDEAISWPLLAPIALIAGWIVCQLLGYGLQAAASNDYLGKSAVQWAPSIVTGVITWQVLIALSVFRRVVRLGWFSSVLLTLPIAAMIAWSLLYPPTRFWYSDATELDTSSEVRESVASEEILELQAGLIYEQLNALEPHRPGVVDLYFIAFGSYASQDVFRKELAVIHPLMDQRFDTMNRSIRLVNSNSTLREYPIATVSNLRRAIAAIREKIDPEEDIVMLYLTTHGSKEHLLAVDHPPLELSSIDPELLKSLFEEAGIRYRVIVVSACYSGGFVAPLKNDQSLVLTAADADRTSFGCSDDSNFTYFGRAVFDEQLRQTYSFTQAFENALPILREREKTMDASAEFSNPQMALGGGIVPKLQALERRLAARNP